MATAFALLFFASLVGLVKPYIKGTSRKHFGIAAVGFFVLFALVAPPSSTTPKTAVAASETDQSSTSSDSPATEPFEPPSSWKYDQQRDDMRGTIARYAETRSINTVDLDFPYGTVNGIITIRQRPEDGLNVMFAVDKGQILCSSFRDSYVSIKFDDGPIQRFSCTDSSDGTNDVAFISNADRALNALKKSKRAVIEAEFYQQGRQQFSFETAGLEWK